MKLHATKEDQELIVKIAERVEEMYGMDAPKRIDIILDITACHLNGCPLRLADLLYAPPFDFAHDVQGIHKYIDHNTGKLEGNFYPRFAATGTLQTRTLTKEDIDRIFDDPEMTNQVQVCEALYKLILPEWDDIKAVDGWPTCGHELALYVMGRFMEFDRKHHPNVMNGGLWMNKGWAQDETLGPWVVSRERCKVTLEEGR